MLIAAFPTAFIERAEKTNGNIAPIKRPTITVGFEDHYKYLENLFIAFENGDWEYDSVQDFLDGNPSRVRVIKPVDGALMTGAAIVDIDMNTFYIDDIEDNLDKIYEV